MRLNPNHRINRASRSGKVLVAFAVTMPAALAVLALYIDGSVMMVSSRQLQDAADAAATAAALSAATGISTPEAVSQNMVTVHNHHIDATVTVEHPPASGIYSGDQRYVHVRIEEEFPGYFSRLGGSAGVRTLGARAVAGYEAVTDPAAVILLDPSPSPLTLSPLPISLPSLTPLLGGLEVIGLGELVVGGALLVNNQWAGLDENGDEVGESESSLPRAACVCTPVLPTTRVRATNIRVVGGVDNPNNYSGLSDADPSPLTANRRPVPDPLLDLPVPTTSADPQNVSSRVWGGRTLLLAPAVTLQPGVYDWISATLSNVTFEPGVYIIRGTDPVTGISLNLLSSKVTAEHVTFYITNSATYTPGSGLPDQNDNGEPEGMVPASLFPSVLISDLLTGSTFTPTVDHASPYRDVLFFQRRWDHRPLIIAQTEILANLQLSGIIYAKWAHLVYVGRGNFETACAVGSLRVLPVGSLRIVPQYRFPPAHDIFLVQ